MASNKIRFLIGERRTIDDGPVARQSNVSEAFRALLEDLDNDIYEAAFPEDVFDFFSTNSLPEVAKKARSEAFHFILFYKIIENNYGAPHIIRDVSERMQQGQGPIVLVTFNAQMSDLPELIKVGSLGRQEKLNPFEACIYETWLESLQTPGIIHTANQEMSTIADLMKKIIAE